MENVVENMFYKGVSCYALCIFFVFAIFQMGRSGLDCAVNIILGSDGANGGLPGAGIYEPDEVVIVMIPSIMIITFLIIVDLFKKTNFFDPKFHI